MTWWIDIPHKTTKYGECIWREHDFEVYEHQSHLTLFKQGYSVGATARRVFDKKYKGDFYNWIAFLRQKDMDKIEYTRSMIEETENNCKFIENLWNKEGE